MVAGFSHNSTQRVVAVWVTLSIATTCRCRALHL